MITRSQNNLGLQMVRFAGLNSSYFFMLWSPEGIHRFLVRIECFYKNATKSAPYKSFLISIFRFRQVCFHQVKFWILNGVFQTGFKSINLCRFDCRIRWEKLLMGRWLYHIDSNIRDCWGQECRLYLTINGKYCGSFLKVQSSADHHRLKTISTASIIVFCDFVCGSFDILRARKFDGFTMPVEWDLVVQRLLVRKVHQQPR